jgi:hypothetical protein
MAAEPRKFKDLRGFCFFDPQNHPRGAERLFFLERCACNEVLPLNPQLNGARLHGSRHPFLAIGAVVRASAEPGRCHVGAAMPTLPS